MRRAFMLLLRGDEVVMRSTSSTVPAWPSTVTSRRRAKRVVASARPTTGGHAVLAGEDRQVAERAAGLGDEAGRGAG